METYFIKLFMLCTILVSLSFDTSNSFKHAISTRTYGGKPARLGQFPYQVLIFLRDRARSTKGRYCGGTIISPQYILTAAHCLCKKNTKIVEDKVVASVRLGTVDVDKSNKQKEGQRYEVRRNNFIVHEDYNPYTSENDIALIKLPEHIKVTKKTEKNIKVALLPSLKYSQKVFGKPPFNITISGYGITGNYNDVDRLRYITTKIIPIQKCIDNYGRKQNINESKQLCVNSPGTSTCVGDSGSPVAIYKNSTRDGIIVGIVSFSSKSGCTTGKPQVMTRVDHYLRWIHEKSGISIPAKQVI